MGSRLLPLTVSELCTHALRFERDAARRCQEYAARMRELGDRDAAGIFEQLLTEEIQEMRALEAVSGEKRLVELQDWETICGRAFPRQAPEGAPRLAVLNAPEALQLTMLVKRRAQDFYADVAENAAEDLVRGCAAEMAANEQRQLRWLALQFADLGRRERAPRASRAGDGSLSS
jgi:rubrerythrin